MIIKGEQYIIPIKITQNNQVITPLDVTDVRIKVGDYLKEYSKGELTFNNSTLEWEYPLEQELTVGSLGLTVPIQVGIKDDWDIYYSTTDSITLGESIIIERW